MLERLTIPIDDTDFDPNRSQVSVTLTVTDRGWEPTFPDDEKWDGTDRKMEEVLY